MRCNSSFTPGRLNPSFNPFGLNTLGAPSAPAAGVLLVPVVFGFLLKLLLFGFLNTLIMTSAF
ncbi:MAG: hypothetical protein ACK50A_01430 [Sphingobacteriaceae bacterium]|jgi:hypothetical protein